MTLTAINILTGKTLNIFRLSEPIHFGDVSDDVTGTTRYVTTSSVLVPARDGTPEYWETAVFASNGIGNIIGAPLDTVATPEPAEALWGLGYKIVGAVPARYTDHDYLTEQITGGLSAFLEAGTFTAAGSEWNPVDNLLYDGDAPFDEIALTFADAHGLEVSLSLTVHITKVEGN